MDTGQSVKGVEFLSTETRWGQETRFGGEEWVCVLEGRRLGLLRGPLGLDYFLERDTAAQGLGCQKCKPAFWIVAERVFYLLRVKGPHIPATGLTHSHDGGKIWPFLMDKGIRYIYYKQRG